MTTTRIVTTIVLLAFCLPLRAGETLHYPGAELKVGQARQTPLSLFPDLSSPNENKVYVRFDPETEADRHIPGYIMGGYSDVGDVKSNVVRVMNGSSGRTVCGGYSDAGSAVDNEVNIAGGKFGVFDNDSRHGNIAGGASDKKDAVNNRVTITGGTFGADGFDGFVRGGRTVTGNAIDNKVIIYDGTIDKNVYGGYVMDGTGTATGNRIIIFGGDLDDYVLGGYSFGGLANGNTVTMFGGTVDNAMFGGQSINGDAVNNTIIIADGEVEEQIFGGYSEQGNAIGNKVTVSGGIVTTEGGIAGEFESDEEKKKASPVENSPENKEMNVSLPNEDEKALSDHEGIVRRYNVFGGYVKKGKGNANGNTITVSDATVDNNVICGYVGGDGNANYNTVNLFGGAKLNRHSDIFGGFTSGGGNVVTGNTLNATAFIGEFGNIHNFHTVNINETSEVTLTENVGTRFVDLNNAGCIRFVDGKPDTRITVAGEYVGRGCLEIEADFDRGFADKISFRNAPVGTVRIEILNQGGITRHVEPKNGPVIATVDKDAESADIVLADPQADANHHWVLERDGNDFRLGVKHVSSHRNHRISPQRNKTFRRIR